MLQIPRVFHCVSCLRSARAVQCTRPRPKIGDKSQQIPRYSPICPRGQPPRMATDKCITPSIFVVAETSSYLSVCCILYWQASLKAMETSGNSILSGYPVLRGPVSLIVNIKVCVGHSLQICRKLPWNTRCNPWELKNTTYFHIQMRFPNVRASIKDIPLLQAVNNHDMFILLS